SRVARVCKRDSGGPHNFRNRWTSFLKARLNCSVPGDFPFYFNEMQSTTDMISGVYGGNHSQLMYGVFTTPVNSISGSAVCAFSLRDINKAFESSFKEQAEMNANWLPVPPNKVPDPRPGQCVNDSRTLPDLTLNFIKTHSLMDGSVASFFRQPVVIRTSFNYRFTQIAVDPQVKTPGGKAYDVLFIGTGPEVSAADSLIPQYSVETLAIAVVAGAAAALLIGFAMGYLCGRKCKKDDDDNLPYPDTEYEYFEQRQNVNRYPTLDPAKDPSTTFRSSRLTAEPKLLPQEEVTYAEPLHLPTANSKSLNSPKSTLRKVQQHANSTAAQETLFQFPEAYAPPSYAQQRMPRDNFGTLRSHHDGFGTTRSVKKVYL
ncbi:hypothetical protein FOCC_FOCC006782, partial [Frankliniella occidentalis]